MRSELSTSASDTVVQPVKLTADRRPGMSATVADADLLAPVDEQGDEQPGRAEEGAAAQPSAVADHLGVQVDLGAGGGCPGRAVAGASYHTSRPTRSLAVRD